MKYKSYKEIIDRGTKTNQYQKSNKRLIQDVFDKIVDNQFSMLEIAIFMTFYEKEIIEDMNQTMHTQCDGTRQYGRYINDILGRDEHRLAIYTVMDLHNPNTEYGRMVIKGSDDDIYDMYTGGADRHKVEDISMYNIETQKEIEKSIRLLNEKLKTCRRRKTE